MAAPILSALPARFNAGNTVKYTRRHAAYPAGAGWAMVLHISGAATWTVAASANGDAFDVTIPATKTATVTVSACATTADSKVVTRATGNFTTDGVLPGYLVHGSGIPSGAYVKTVDSTTQVTLSEAATATAASISIAYRYPPGLQTWEERVTLAVDVYTADSGVVSIDPDISGAPAGALQSWESRMLPLVEDIIEGRVGTDAESYQVADRAKTAVRMRDWLSFRGYLQAAIRQQQTPGRITMVRAAFTGAGAEA